MKRDECDMDLSSEEEECRVLNASNVAMLREPRKDADSVKDRKVCTGEESKVEEGLFSRVCMCHADAHTAPAPISPNRLLMYTLTRRKAVKSKSAVVVGSGLLGGIDQ